MFGISGTRWLSVLAFIVALYGMSGFAAAAEQNQPFRIFHVMSFDSPWRWSDGQFGGFKTGLGEINAEYKVFQMDIKRYSTQEERAARGVMARAIIKQWQPDLVYISDDAGIEYIAAHYRNHELPFVFSGANKSIAEHGLERMRNLTGVLEYEHFVESIRLLRNIVPSVTRIAVIRDMGSHWAPVIQRIRDRMADIPMITLVAVDQVESYARFQALVRGYEQIADAVVYLGVFNYKRANGQAVPYQELQRWVVEHSELPEISFWIDRIHYGVLAAVTVSEIEQGIAAGKLARAILVDRRPPDSLPVAPTVKGRPAINLARAKQLGIKVKSTELLSSEVVTDFEWQRPVKDR